MYSLFANLNHTLIDKRIYYKKSKYFVYLKEISVIRTSFTIIFKSIVESRYVLFARKS